MTIARWKTAAILVPLLAFAALDVAACGGGGGGSDNDKVQARVRSFFDHVTKGDAKGLINDLPPDSRKGCDEGTIKQALAFVKAFDMKMKETKVKNNADNKPEVDITTSAKLANQA